jgi:hypothetical protein
MLSPRLNNTDKYSKKFILFYIVKEKAGRNPDQEDGT